MLLGRGEHTVSGAREAATEHAGITKMESSLWISKNGIYSCYDDKHNGK